MAKTGDGVTDYWLSKLFFDLQRSAIAAEYRADRKAVLRRYPLKPAVRNAGLDYRPVPEIYIGCAWATWENGAAA